MLSISLKATHIELTPAIRQYAEEKVAMLGKLIPDDDTSAKAAVEVGQTTHHHQKGPVFFAEINLHVAGENLRAVAEEEDLYAAIDKAKDEMMRELRGRKGRRETLARRGGRAFKGLLQKFGTAFLSSLPE